MTTFKRIRLVAMILGGVLLVQGALLAHMFFGPANVYPTLRKPFSKLPSTIEVAKDQKETDKKKGPYVWTYVPTELQDQIPGRIPFTPVDLSHRRAACPELNLSAVCYVVHAENGEDRRHHPEICIRGVLQMPESKQDHKTVHLGGDAKRAVQRYVFQQNVGMKTAVYYWYYVFTPIPQPDQTRLQSLYHTFNRMPPSVTVEVIVDAPEQQWADVETKLLVPLDKMLREQCLPAEFKMGCDRLPIGLQVTPPKADDLRP